MTYHKIRNRTTIT